VFLLGDIVLAPLTGPAYHPFTFRGHPALGGVLRSFLFVDGRRLMIRVLPFLAALLGALTFQTLAFADAIYDASAFLSISSSSFNVALFPGIAFTPPPGHGANSVATNSASASTPGELRAAASGYAGNAGFASSAASAVAFGTAGFFAGVISLSVNEQWSVAASADPSWRASATTGFLILLDGTVIESAVHTLNANVGGPFSEAGNVTKLLSLPIGDGVHLLDFSVNAGGVAFTPEPTTLLLVSTTAAGLGYFARRRRKGKAAGF
jgi:hypothetical protein